MNILIINGPNLNLIGIREPQIYGTRSLSDYLAGLREAFLPHTIATAQTNHEGVIIDILQDTLLHHTADAVVLNAGGYTHTSVSIRDAVTAVREAGIEVVEVHISDINQREPFRRHSFLTPVCSHSIIGQGLEGYRMALEWLIQSKAS